MVSHVKVLSNRVEDVSSLEAWRNSFIKEGMSDEQKGLAVWRSVVTFVHQDSPPKEYLQADDDVVDPMKLFNVYGYTYCSPNAASVIALARYAGLQARGWTIRAHVVPEILWDGSYHLLDASLINYFPKPDGKLASVEEIVAAVTAWLAAKPDYKANDAKLREFHRADGWTGWKNGPDLLANCAFYGQDGWLPAGTHGWYSTMQEYDGSTLFAYETAYSLGYQVNVQLRTGERLTRNWSNKGLHVRMDEDGAPGCATMKVGQSFLRYTPKYGDIAPGRVGNGTLEYDVPLADGVFRYSALKADNLACKADDKKDPAVHVQDAAQPGLLEIRMPSSYVYLSGELSFKAVVGNGGQIAVFLSDNNGLEWKEVTTVTAPGEQRVDLKPLVFRRYDYRLRFVLKGKGTGLDALRISHDIQHSQRPLPALAQGSNTITFSAGPQEGTITIEGCTKPDNKGKQVLCSDFHPVLNGVEPLFLRVSGTPAEATFPIQTPGDMTALRIGIDYRARDKQDAWDVSASFDGGKTFTPMGRCEGPAVNFAQVLALSDIPAGTRSALVKFSGTQRNTTCILNLRINADYQEPNGGFRPMKVTYVWEEGGIEKRDVHIASKPDETYQITCESTPFMKSLILELAP